MVKVVESDLRLRLKENFDRFNSHLYKEKQMVDFRRYLTGLAVVAVMATAASAQVGVANGSANSLFACVATAAGTPELRPEGYTELVGDIVITCTGGPLYAPGVAIPTTNITVYMVPGVPITSRYMSSNGASDALLIIDEAGSNITTGVAGNFGPKATQKLCTTANQQALGGSACTAIVGTDAGTAGGPYEVATDGAGNSAANVYQGKIGDFGPHTVTFYAVPVLPPATSGVTRTFRITNVRVPVPGGLLTGTLQAFISTSPSTVLPLSSTAINIGVVGRPMTAAVGSVTSFQQCLPQTKALASVITFTEGFATAFKTRVVPGGAANGTSAATNTKWAAEQINTAAPNNQNIPGGLYGGFAQNSESGFIYSGLNTGTSTGYTAGLADFGTRLKAVFYNIPAGQTLYVSNGSFTYSNGVTTYPTLTPGGTSMTPYAVLVATNTGEATSDGSAFSDSNVIGGGAGVPPGTQVALTADSTGKAVAVWEIVNSNPSATDVLQFGVYTSYTAASATTSFPYGTPITDLPLGTPLNDVQLSMAPEPGGGTFTTANSTQGQNPIPKFASVATYEGRFLRINLCQTTLLYPFVTGAQGFDTGIAVANTSTDPFGTVKQTGSCRLYGYGVTVGASGNTATSTLLQGCDELSNPLEGTNCFGIVPSGQVKSVMAATVLQNFTGYVIAVCNFQYAHGYAAVTDLGLRNLWSSYLALELNYIGSNAPAGTVGSPRVGTSSIEILVH